MEKLLDFQNKEDQELLLTLPRVKSWDFPYFYQYQGFWYPSMFPPHRYTLENTPLVTTSPHDLIPFLETQVYGINQFSILEDHHTPRTLATHLPYTSLPPSLISSSCRIVYLCRNPWDQFISHWHFAPKIQDRAITEPILLDDGFEMLCQGVQWYGPIWDHMLGYWKASLEKPDKILFLKYEDLQEDIISCLKKVPAFLGCPFTDEEETRGKVMEAEKLGESSGLMTFKFNQSSSAKRDI
ncbi:hypothetical protein ACOSQ2_031936 [Xanthoceras sorbifolium]